MLTKKIIGDSYEYYILDKIKNDYDKVWHWKDFPESILYELNIIKDYDIFSKYRYDIGADLVAKKDNVYYFIQCKNFKDTILMENLAGFYFLLYEYNLNGILYYNGNLSQRVKDLSNRVKLINMPFNNQTIKTHLVENKLIIPREYQIQAYNKLKDYNKCILQLPCGMGKTFTASLLAKDYDNIIILSPLRSLAQQLLNNFKEYLYNEYNPILISMDGYRNIETINKFIKDKNIISSTYDSSDVIIQIIDKLKNVLLIIDEFHNLSFNNLNNIDDNLYKIINKLEKHLYLSATPIKDFKCDYKYEYSWQDAIKNKYICDFEIVIHENNKELYKFANLLKSLCNDEIDIKLVGKAYFILKGLMFNGNRKCICYMTCIEKSKQMTNILYWLSKFLNIELEANMITYNTSKINREQYINKFKNSLKLSIIINVHILDEGIDIPECDSVFITKPSYNIINIVQRMCRANRIVNDKDKCYIYLWCGKNKTNKILNYLSDNTSGIIDNKVVKFSCSIIDEKFKITENKSLNESISNFLKQFSTIPQDFITDFLIIAKEEYTYNELVIDFELICKWLEVNKSDLKKVLVKNFKINFDYTIEKITKKQVNSRGATVYEKILITPNCMKELCMVSQTAKAKEVRKYFIEMEKLVKR